MKIKVKQEVYRTFISYTIRGDKTNTEYTYVAQDKLSESKAKALVTSIISDGQKNAKMAYNWVESSIQKAVIEQEVEIDENNLSWCVYEIPTRKSRKKVEIENGGVKL